MRSHRVPREWQDVVCTCFDAEGTKHCEDKSCIEMHCRDCGKLKRFYASYCGKCRNFYVIAFYCRNWTPSNNLCWDCLTGIDGHHVPEGQKQCRPPLPWVKPQPVKSLDELAEALANAFK